ncbi:glycosyltransferase [Agromyces bauzanensis]
MPDNSLDPSPASAPVFKNRWRDRFDGTLPDGWRPSLTVSVVIASYNSATLPLTLASLAAQDYPQELLDVTVVDDGSEPPVEFGAIVPKNLQLIRVGEGDGWGRSNATDIGIRATKGDIIYWVDADMVLFRDNVTQHAKWAHFIPEAATIGHKGFVEAWDYTPEAVYQKVLDGSIAEDYDPSTLHEHWSIDIFRQTDDLNTSDGRNYSTHMGACATVTREIYDRTRGQDIRLHLGEDTEIAYQIWQAGGVFIPVNDARTWHLGRATIQDHAAKVAWHNDVHFAQRMPIPRYRRRSANRIWEVPLVHAVVEVTPETAQFARQCVDRILASTLTDVHVTLAGPWSLLHEGRRKLLSDPLNELYLVREWLRSDGRVHFVEEVPQSVFPAPFRLDVPVTVGLSSDSLRQMYRSIDTRRVGAVRFFTPGHDKDASVTIWDSAATARARRYVDAGHSVEERLEQVWGFEWGSNEIAQLVDLRTEDLDMRVTAEDPKVNELSARLEQMTERAKKAEWRLRKELAANRSVVRRGIRSVVRRLGRPVLHAYRAGGSTGAPTAREDAI